MIAQVLYDDLAFEREFALIPRDTYSTIAAAKSFEDVPFDRWRELDADGVVVGTVQKMGAGIHVEVRLFNVRTHTQAFGKGYDGSAANPRLYAHTVSDELHLSQRGLRGVARSKVAFASDRDGERMGGTIESRSVQGDLHRRLRRRGPEAGHDRPIAEYPAELVAGRTLGRLHVVPARAAEHLRLAHLPGHARRVPQGAGPEGELPADVVSGRDAGGVLVDPRRQPRAVHRESRRLQRPPPHHESRRSTSRPRGRRRARRSPLSPIEPARPRSTRSAPTAWGCAGSRPGTPMPRGRRGPRCRSTKSRTPHASVPATTSR